MILVKKLQQRTPKDLEFLVKYLGSTPFLKDLKLPPQTLSPLLAHFHLEHSTKDKYVIRHGQAASSFFVILDGTVSLWSPVRPQAMLKPLHHFRVKLQEAIQNSETKLEGFNFKFHIEPFEIETDRRPIYCTYSDFKKLCSSDQGEEFV